MLLEFTKENDKKPVEVSPFKTKITHLSHFPNRLNYDS